MAWYQDFIRAIRQDDEEERRREQEGGTRNRVFGFLDDALDVGGEVGSAVVGTAAGLGREVLVKPAVSVVKTVQEKGENDRRSAVESTLAELQKLTYDERKAAMESNAGLKLVLKNRGLEDPTDENIKSISEQMKKDDEANDKGFTPEGRMSKMFFGNEPIQAYQNRKEGLEETWKDELGGFAGPAALLGSVVNMGLDAPSGGGAAKSAGKKVITKGASLVDDVIPTVAKQAPKAISMVDDFVDAANPANLLSRAKSVAGRPYEAIQQQIEAAHNAGKDDIVDKLLQQIPKADRAGIDPRGAVNNAVKMVVDPITKKIVPKAVDAVDEVVDDVAGAIPPGPPRPPVDQLVDTLLPGQRQRGLLKTTQEKTDQLADETKAAIGEITPQGYTPMNMQKTLDAARERIRTDLDGVRNTVFEKLDVGQWDDEVSSNAIALLEDANRRGDTQLAKELMEKTAYQGTASGQANVLWRTFVNSNTPEGMVKFAQRMIDDANKNMGFLTKTISRRGKGAYKLGDETIASIKAQMEQANKLADGPEKDEIFKGIMRTINDEIPPGASELIDAYRYQNMLSGPRTQARNIIGTGIQAGATVPLTKIYQGGIDFMKAGLFGKQREDYVKDVPVYYKGMLNGFGNAIEEFKKGWAGDIQQPDLKKLRSYSNEKMPKALTIVGRAMEAQDRFFQTLIRNGEYAVQKMHGATDEVAESAAEKMGKYAVFRQGTDAKNVTGQGALLSKIDAVTDTMTKIGQQHKAFRWFVPFIQTPANISKQMIEISPAGFATLYKASGNKKKEQLARAALGSTITGIGAMMAFNGDTTWSVPTDPKEREVFYSSGKKPYSVRIGDTWVPMITFGPMGYSLGIPAAIKDANDKGDLNDSALDKIGDIIGGQANFFTQQTYLQGVSNFVNALTGQGTTGDLGKDLMSAAGSAAGQLIPLQGLSRFVNSAIDPVLRKKKGAVDTFMADLPIVGAEYSKNNLEANKNIFTGEDSKRNASDYVAPYSMGKESTNPDDKAFQEGVGEFYKVRGKVGDTRKRADEYIAESLSRGDYGEAYNAALDYNDWLKEQFAPWAEQYGEYASDDMQEMYNRLKISTNGLKRRRQNLLENQNDSTINYR